MRLTSSLPTSNITPAQARTALNELRQAYRGTAGRIVFEKNDKQEIIGASRSRGLWSAIKSVFSKSYRTSLATTEKEFGELWCKATGITNLTGTEAVQASKRAIRDAVGSGPMAQHFRGYGLDARPNFIEGQVTPGLIDAMTGNL